MVLEAGFNQVKVTLNTTADIEHVPGIEQKILVIKERVRVIWDTHPYTILPSRMISKMVYY